MITLQITVAIMPVIWKWILMLCEIQPQSSKNAKAPWAPNHGWVLYCIISKDIQSASAAEMNAFWLYLWRTRTCRSRDQFTNPKWRSDSWKTNIRFKGSSCNYLIRPGIPWKAMDNTGRGNGWAGVLWSSRCPHPIRQDMPLKLWFFDCFTKCIVTEVISHWWN